MNDIFIRTKMLIGDEPMEKLKKARVAVFGVGGVGGFAVETLVRSGIGSIDVIDHDIVDISNINRQLIATQKTVGRPKVEVIKDRIQEINPEVQVRTHQCFFLKENSDEFEFEKYNYIIDAIDTISGKLELIEKAREANVPIISAMGAGNKLDATKFEVADIYSTSICPLAKVMRKELRKRQIESLKVVYSKEAPRRPITEDGEIKRGQAPGSIAFVPSVVGIIIAGEVIKDIGRINR